MFKKLIDYLRNLNKKFSVDEKETIPFKGEITTPRQKMLPENVEHEDSMTRENIARCFNTGNIVMGNRNEDGTWEIKEFNN